MNSRSDTKLLFLIDRIEDSSYPVTETGYALVHRAWLRAVERGHEIYVAYPDTVWHEIGAELIVNAQRVLSFVDAPYDFYRSQHDHYRSGEDVGSPRCHLEGDTTALSTNALGAVIWRQETGEPMRARALLQALARAERDTVVYLSPRLALDPRFSSKTLPHAFEPSLTPRSFHTDEVPGADLRDKALHAAAFVRAQLRMPETVIAKPLHGDNGIGIRALGFDPVSGERTPIDDLNLWRRLLEEHGDLVVQEYIPSVRSPFATDASALAAVPHDRRDFGEIRFLLIDGEVPRDAHGQPCLVARRVPNSNSLIADSGISYATSLSDDELFFLETLGAMYRRLGIYFGGGDLIRTPDPARPFLFTDAAQSVCGHAVVTGALNNAPHLIIDQILDSLERRIAAQRSHTSVAAHAQGDMASR